MGAKCGPDQCWHWLLSGLQKTYNIAPRIIQSVFLILLWCFCMLCWTGKLGSIFFAIAGKRQHTSSCSKTSSFMLHRKKSVICVWNEMRLSQKPLLSSCMCLCSNVGHFCNDNLWGGLWEVVLKHCDIPLFNDEQHDTTWSRSITPFIELHQIVWKEKHKLSFCSEVCECIV